ncbi:hypothetical protein BC832DRAFT_67453 [Gaertneriomyces semiglobifer]|nr:hypothetical protein BC832DRAFT_67453 [Gaertneriomyces semiglobifer]
MRRIIWSIILLFVAVVLMLDIFGGGAGTGTEVSTLIFRKDVGSFIQGSLEDRGPWRCLGRFGIPLCNVYGCTGPTLSNEQSQRDFSENVWPAYATLVNLPNTTASLVWEISRGCCGISDTFIQVEKMDEDGHRDYIVVTQVIYPPMYFPLWSVERCDEGPPNEAEEGVTDMWLRKDVVVHTRRSVFYIHFHVVTNYTIPEGWIGIAGFGNLWRDMEALRLQMRNTEGPWRFNGTGADCLKDSSC